VGRCDDADAPVAAARELGPSVLGQQERAGQQQGQHRVPAVLGEVGDRRHVLEPGVGDDRVDPAEALQGRVDRRAVALARRQVGGEGLARAVSRRPQVDRKHPHPVADQPLRDRAPDAAPRAGDEGNRRTIRRRS
jgi:hypothetical protein